MPEISGDVGLFIRQVGRLEALVGQASVLPPEYQKLVTEIVLLRLFDLFQEAIAVIAAKLVCGAEYMDGTSASPLVPVRGVASAYAQMRSLGRTRPVTLKWTKASYVNDNLRHLLVPTEHYLHELNGNGVFIDEMRRVRNRIAHNNSLSRGEYYVVVRRYYGACPNGVTPGLLLQSPRRRPALVRQYLAKARILVRSVAKAPAAP